MYKHNPNNKKEKINLSIWFDVLIEITWWEIWQGRIRCWGPIVQPNFKPVDENVFPALPIVNVLSHIFGNVAIRICFLFSLYTIHS